MYIISYDKYWRELAREKVEEDHVLLEDVSNGRLVIVFCCDRGLHLFLNTCNLAPHESEDLFQRCGAQGREGRARNAPELDIATRSSFRQPRRVRTSWMPYVRVLWKVPAVGRSV